MKWKIATFNVNGVRSREHVVISWIERNRPDVLCLQEIKCQDCGVPCRFRCDEVGYEASVCGQKSFHGVAILSLRKPEEVRRGFGDGESDTEARLIAAKIDGIWIFNTYVPQGRSPEHPAFQIKLDFFARLKSLFQREFTPSDPVIWTGDINVAPEELDVFLTEKNGRENRLSPSGKTGPGRSGFLGIYRPVSKAPSGCSAVHLLGLPPAREFSQEPGLEARSHKGYRTDLQRTRLTARWTSILAANPTPAIIPLFGLKSSWRASSEFPRRQNQPSEPFNLSEKAIRPHPGGCLSQQPSA